MDDTEDVTDVKDDVPDEIIERIITLDLKERLVFLRGDLTDYQRAYKIHQAVLEVAMGANHADDFSRDNRNYQKQPSFAPAILNAYRNKKFRAILSWRPDKSPTFSSSPTPSGNTHREAAKSTMARQYSVPYKGQVATLFAKFVQTHAQQSHRGKQSLYANVIPVVQSSGTGKSRMLTETGKILFTLPFCARKQNGAGWPPGDHHILPYLLTSPDDQFSIKTHITFIAFLAAIFAEMECVLKSFDTSDIDALRQRWHGHMEPAHGASTIPTRDVFYAEVLRRTKVNESQIRTLNSTLPSLPNYSEGDVDLRRKFFRELANRVQQLSVVFLKAKIKALLTVIPKEVLLVYMDEAHTFNGRYWALQRVLCTLKEHDMLWFSFMGTNASLSEFVPAAVDLKSLRLADEMMVLPPPYMTLGFDQNIIDLTLDQPLTMGQVRSLDWICNFGRPLWKASILASISAGGDVEKIFQDAKVKLLCSSTGYSESTEQVFAILAYTVCFDLVLGNRKAMEIANTSVAEFMRLLIGVNTDRTVCFTEASSEPILALVGASIIANKGHLSSIITKLTAKLTEGVVDKGRHGELLARMILFLARIKACSSPSTPLSFATPVPVVQFFKTLFGEELWNKTHGHERFEKGLEGGYVNFYHFTLMQDAMPVKEDLNFEANIWTRGTALQCNFRQVDINGHIPVYWGPIDDGAVLDPNNFSSLDYQVKFQKESSTGPADKIQQPASDRHSVKRSSHPFIAVFLDMGCEPNYTSTESRLWLETGEQTLERLKVLAMTEMSARRQKIMNKAIKALTLDSNRYCISAQGCDEGVFGVLNALGITEKWQKLVSATVETPDTEGEIMETMRPLHRFALDSGYSNWMKDHRDVLTN